MSGASSLFQLWQCPPTKLLLLKSSRLYGGCLLNYFCGLMLSSPSSESNSAAIVAVGVDLEEIDQYSIGAITGPKSYSIQCFCRGLQTTAYDEVVNGSYIPTAQITEENRAKTSITVEKSTKLEHMGAFQKLPMVMPSADIFYSAVKKSKRIAPTKGIANIAKRERNRGAKQLDALMKELAIPLRMYLEQFPNKNYLHPYERSLIELTLGDGNYEEVLGKINNLRKKVVSVGKEHAALCAKSSSKRDAEERLMEGMKRVEEVYSRDAKAVDDLLDIAKTLRAMPVVDLETPTLCLVGAPNVGKSSLVRVLSSGKPEVCNYPFTTRGILMGHIVLDYQHFQVTDTPGLLNRSDEDRNNLEKLTLAVLSHLPTAILYVHDLSGECGTSPSNQFILYKEIKRRFGDHLWLDVVSKCDLLQNISAASDNQCKNSDLELEHYKKLGPVGALYVSVKNELGLVKLKDTVHKQLISQLARIKDPNSNQEA